MFNKKYQPNFRNKFTPNTNRGNFKVRGPIKSFRDLDVYNKSTELSAEIFTLHASEDSGLSEELALLKNLSKHIPKMIAESYGNRFDRFAVAERKLEKTAEVISSVIAKIDFILSVLKKEESGRTGLLRKLAKTTDGIASSQAPRKDGNVAKTDGGEDGRGATVSASLSEAVQNNAVSANDSEAVQTPTTDEAGEFKKRVEVLLREYTTVRMKVLNLKRSWVKLNEKFGNPIK